MMSILGFFKRADVGYARPTELVGAQLKIDKATYNATTKLGAAIMPM
jgi:hypothetical protein